jgi:Septum formation
MRHLVTVLAVAVLTLTACSGTSSSTPSAGSTPVLSSSPPTTSTAPAPVPDPPPPVHACYRFGFATALATTTTSASVPCSRPHTAVTLFVGRFPKAVPVDGPRARRIEARVCPRRFATFVGGTLQDRRLSLLRTVWFVPSTEQAALGARWFQCVAIALRGDQHLAGLDVPVKGALDREAGRSHYGLCATDRPGTPDFAQRLCAARHTWRALSTVAFAPGTYPGVAKVKAAGQTPCRDAAGAAASDPLNFQWSYAWPTRLQWRAGQTYGICWVPA